DQRARPSITNHIPTMLIHQSSLAAMTLAALACMATLDPPGLPRDSLPADIPCDTIPRGLPANRLAPKDNALTAAKVQLGWQLFFDPILSRNKTVACASCHDPAQGFASVDAVAIGIEGKKGRRNAPSLLNRAFSPTLFWDGRETLLEAQVLKPIEDP